MTKKLLNKSTAALLAFSVVVMLLSAPVFYLIAEKMYLDEMNETLTLQKEDFFEKDLPHFKTSEIPLWNKYNRNVKILADEHLKKDTLFTIIYFDALENENEPYRELKAPLVIQGKAYTFSARISLIEEEDLIFGVSALFLLVIALLLGGILWLNKLVSKRVWKPFYNTLDQIQDFEIDKNRKPEFAATDVEEFNRLNKSLDRLIEKNTAIYKTQREFVENAAHELQTPLALFQSKIDNLLQTGISAEQSPILDSLNTDVGRLNRLNKNLLLLSKIENDGYAEKQFFSVNEYFERNKAFFDEQAAAKKLIIVYDLKQEISLHANAVLAEILISNLLLNAIRHSVPDGKIVVLLGNDLLDLGNTGDKPLSQDKLFNRFYKSDASSKGNGLGLAIVRRITEINGWKITYDFNNGQHHFLVAFG